MKDWIWTGILPHLQSTHLQMSFSNMNKRVDIEIFVCSTVSWEKQVEKKTQKQNKEKYETDAKRNSLVMQNKTYTYKYMYYLCQYIC